MAEGERDETAERLDQNWREACRADPLASRAPLPPGNSSLPRSLVEAVRLGDSGASYFERVAPRAIDDRLSGIEAMRQLSILGVCHLNQLGDDVRAIGQLVHVVARGHEAVASMFISRSDEKARRDALTGLLNVSVYRPDFNRGVDAAIAGSGTVVLVNFDLNAFKVVNDTRGHAGGDRFLKHFAQLIDRVVRPIRGQAYRVGGDEFVALVRDGDRATAEAVIAEMRQRPECPPLSFGISSIPDDLAEALSNQDDEESVMIALEALADKRMYEMKEKATGEQRAQLTAAWLAEGHLDA